MLSAILFAFLLSILAVILATVMIGAWLVYRKFIKSEDCNKILKEIILNYNDNKQKIN